MTDAHTYWTERLRACLDEIAFIKRCLARAEARAVAYRANLANAKRGAA